MKPYKINLNPIIYISLYTKEKCKIINNLLCIILFKKLRIYI